MARTWNAVLARLGVPTGDGRIIDPAGGSSRDLPLPLMWQELSDDGHGGSRVVGRIETMRIADGMVTATGRLLDDIPYAVTEQLEAGIIGPSVDLDDIEYVMDEDERIVITQWRVAGATLVSIPAFADVSLTLDPEPAEPLIEPEPVVADALWAAAGPEPLPPADWFAAPSFDRLTPLTVTPEGRVFGHVAGWSTCHVGLPGCVTPPSSPSGYSYFHVGEQRLADGTVTPAGTLVAGPRHADLAAGFQAAQQHYDDPAAAVARVIAGEDEHGVWVAGWLLPGAAPEAVETFKSSPVSGDWRRIGGALELIGVCSVNVPGFPTPRARVAFSAGAQRALVGAFGITPRTEVPAVVSEPITNDSERARLAWALATTKEH
ncbi:hypothetical protein [Streptomyces drozdowiczii]|uniref:Uncharacterized protein n=1 Tax=Streptomyces drozdowiczii TaxID=202862 RepID=A0ABY6PPF7_9ACTN|nr:hypothetical protein [Streptomyces drozdowiczii]MCX0246417.1 hypothetical protein [Streptomyces drozdowiczii]UZK54080.1 hypothetical protein NEH16_07870 [Streptomyces drozdowiczii]